MDFGFWILDFGSWILDFGFWILDFGSWILDFGFWILDLGFWILDFGFWILDLGFWILDFGFRILDFGFWIVVVSVLYVAAPNAAVWILDFWILDFGFWILDFGFWILDLGFWILDFGFWISDFGFWILDFGFWILDFGFWILDLGFWILDFGFCTRFGFCIRLLLLDADSGRRIRNAALIYCDAPPTQNCNHYHQDMTFLEADVLVFLAKRCSPNNGFVNKKSPSRDDLQFNLDLPLPPKDASHHHYIFHAYRHFPPSKTFRAVTGILGG